MSYYVTTEALVLRTRAFGESDKIVSFLTQSHGKLTGIAKGAKRSKRRFANSLEPFSLVTLRFADRPHRSLVFVHACDLIRIYKTLTTTLEKIAHASYLVEITDELTREREENGVLFDFLCQALNFIDEQGASTSLLVFLELQLLRHFGYQPMLQRCSRCHEAWSFGNGAHWRFSYRDGGLVCRPCSGLRREMLSISVETVAVLTRLQEQREFPLASDAVPPEALREARALLPRFIQYQIHKELKSVRFLDAFLTP
jgi:DNA repair protein RecO (recombination protein O)